MARTFSQRSKEQAAERGEREKQSDEPQGGEYEERSPVTYRGKTLEEIADSFPHIAIPTPSDLKPEGLRQREERRQEETRNLQEQILNRFDFDFNEVQDVINNTVDVDLDTAGTQDLLSLLLQNMLAQNQMMQATVSTEIAQLQALVDIADAVEPGRAITVSGNNDIEDANDAEPVIPGSDNTLIPTRTLFVRAESDNKDDIWIGDDGVQVGEGLQLKPGEGDVFGLDFRDDQLWMISDTAGVEVQLLGLV